ncbi:hypothetical protein Bbelb_125070 [Branchiostoma belcheri]|nr:hypothetical protein Bbelb_125070 [Branchiostoma belcheri]
MSIDRCVHVCAYSRLPPHTLRRKAFKVRVPRAPTPRRTADLLPVASSANFAENYATTRRCQALIATTEVQQELTQLQQGQAVIRGALAATTAAFPTSLATIRVFHLPTTWFSYSKRLQVTSLNTGRVVTGRGTEDLAENAACFRHCCGEIWDQSPRRDLRGVINDAGLGEPNGPISARVVEIYT